jgi:hypothetical protein
MFTQKSHKTEVLEKLYTLEINRNLKITEHSLDCEKNIVEILPSILVKDCYF